MKTSIQIKRNELGPVLGRHPWVFSKALVNSKNDLPGGATVRLEDERGRFLAWGVYNPKSDIRARIYSFEETAELTKEFWRAKIQKAIKLRKNWGLLSGETSACRLIFSEGDGLSGLTVDYYAGHVVFQMTSLAMYSLKAELIEIFTKEVPVKSIWFRAEKNILKPEGVEAESESLVGETPEVIEIEEHGIKYEINLKNAQKTGFYCDQRDNRLWLKSQAKDKKVLDLCTYVGSFALNAADAGAAEVTGVDSSELAIAAAKRNAEINRLTAVGFIEADMFDFLESQKEQSYDIVVLDPPRFAPNRGAKARALQAYYRINQAALRVLKNDGLLFTFSCSHQVSRFDFNRMLMSVYKHERRDGKIIFQGSQATDHPIATGCPETEYLKSAGITS